MGIKSKDIDIEQYSIRRLNELAMGMIIIEFDTQSKRLNTQCFSYTKASFILRSEDTCDIDWNTTKGFLIQYANIFRKEHMSF